jgi:hypothetical protein
MVQQERRGAGLAAAWAGCIAGGCARKARSRASGPSTAGGLRARPRGCMPRTARGSQCKKGERCVCLPAALWRGRLLLKSQTMIRQEGAMPASATVALAAPRGLAPAAGHACGALGPRARCPGAESEQNARARHQRGCAVALWPAHAPNKGRAASLRPPLTRGALERMQFRVPTSVYVPRSPQ